MNIQVGKDHDYGMENGHPPVAEKVLCIDFDGTIMPWGPLFNWDAVPIPGAVEAIRGWHDAGYTIVIFTSRFSPMWLKAADENIEDHREYIYFHLRRNRIPYSYITCEKVPAVAYIDDKAIEFKGKWSDMVDRLSV
jgi:hypothetical protein